MELPKLVGIAGTNGSGKDTLGRLLAERQKYAFVSVSDILREELTKRGILHSRENMRALSTEWQRSHGPGHLSRRAIDSYVLYEESHGYNGLAVGSIRRPSEAEVIKSDGGSIVWIDAPSRQRYEWIQAAKRGRHEDVISYNHWLKDEQIEMSPREYEGDAAINLMAVKAIADIQINNIFQSSSDFRDYIINEFNL